jgi:hypothetical protein
VDNSRIDVGWSDRLSAEKFAAHVNANGEGLVAEQLAGAAASESQQHWEAQPGAPVMAGGKGAYQNQYTYTAPGAAGSPGTYGAQTGSPPGAGGTQFAGGPYAGAPAYGGGYGAGGNT